MDWLAFSYFFQSLIVLHESWRWKMQRSERVWWIRERGLVVGACGAFCFLPCVVGPHTKSGVVLFDCNWLVQRPDYISSHNINFGYASRIKIDLLDLPTDRSRRMTWRILKGMLISFHFEFVPGKLEDFVLPSFKESDHVLWEVWFLRGPLESGILALESAVPMGRNRGYLSIKFMLLKMCFYHERM